jgi:nicotinamidase-related amidase
MERLEPGSSVLLVVDVQERLAAAMAPAAVERVVRNTRILIESAHRLGVPIVLSEQYPKGLGPTVAALADPLRALGVEPIDKLTFDACGEPRVVRAIAVRSPRAVIVAGVETHVCVFQTARELVRRGYAAYVVADAVASRQDDNRTIGLRLCEQAGAIVTATETVVFDWLERAGTETFRAISKLVR